MTKPFSQACENNKQPILDKLLPLLTDKASLLEVGSGTGQHAIHFANALPHITWQTSDLLINHDGINQWLNEEKLANIRPPIEIDFDKAWSIEHVDAIFTANTLHIVNFPLVAKFFKTAGKHLTIDGLLIIYGPFKYNGEFTSPSNGDFDQWLKDIDNTRGIRNFEEVLELAIDANLCLINDYDMPANNQLLVFKKS